MTSLSPREYIRVSSLAAITGCVLLPEYSMKINEMVLRDWGIEELRN
jgi:hypothetical protein